MPRFVLRADDAGQPAMRQPGVQATIVSQILANVSQILAKRAVGPRANKLTLMIITKLGPFSPAAPLPSADDNPEKDA